MPRIAWASAWLLLLTQFANADYLPVVMWHGMGDNCCNPLGMGHIKDLIQEQHNGTYVYSIMIGNSLIEDTEHSIFDNINDQVAQVCAQLQSDPLLAGGYHAVGFSQGGQFLRALAQRCPTPRMHNLAALASQQQGVFGFPICSPSVLPECEQLRQLLTEAAYVPRAVVQRCSHPRARTLITVGGQHQGVFGVPPCEGENRVCEYIRQLLRRAAYSRWVQSKVVQAQYWHDPLNETLYREANIFLPDINQENGINEEYRNNLLQLDNFVLVKFLRDLTVIPRESSWFGFYTPGQDVELQTLQESVLYTEDRLGIKQLDESGRLHFLEYDDHHVSFTDEWFVSAIIEPYFT